MKTKLKERTQEIKEWVQKNEKETTALNNFTLEQRRIYRLGLWMMWHKLNPVE